MAPACGCSAATGSAASAPSRRSDASRDPAGCNSALLDVSDLDAVRAFAAGFAEPRVDVLVHNAGVLPDQRLASAQDHEVTLATHVYGPWLLTQALLPRLRASADARVVFVSSGGMYTQKLDLADCEWRRRTYDGVKAYAQTKRMQVVLAELLAADCQDDRVTVSSMHPGWADTPAVRSSLPRFWAALQGRLRTPAQAADTVIWLAASDAARGRSGRFWFDRKPRSTHLLPWTREAVSARGALRELCDRATSGYLAAAATGAAEVRPRQARSFAAMNSRCETCSRSATRRMMCSSYLCTIASACATRHICSTSCSFSS